MDKFDLREWVGKGEKNLLNERVDIRNIVNGIEEVGKNVKNNPKVKMFVDDAFTGIEITSSDVIKRMLTSIAKDTPDREILNVLKKNLDRRVHEGRKEGPTFLEALLSHKAKLLRFIISALAGIGALTGGVYKLIKGDPTAMEDIGYGLGLIFMAIFIGFGDIGNHKPPHHSKSKLRVIHKRKK